MFDVTKALKKLDEISKEKNWVHDGWKVTGEELREILLAGQEDEEKVMTASEILSRSKPIENPLDAILYKTIDILIKNFEERLARLEEHKHDNADGAINMKYPSKPIEPMATYSEHGVEIGKPEKTVTDSLSIGHLSDIGAFKQKGAKLNPVTDDKPSEFISRDTIYCAVSAGLEKYRTTWAKENRGVRDCVTDTVMDTIKQQLE